MSCEYVRATYGVPAEIGRRVIVNGKPGIIAADKGHYIGVNFDASKPGVITNAHPASSVEYLGMGTVRKPSKSAARAARFRQYGDSFRSFIEFCRWDANPQRSWNQ